MTTRTPDILRRAADFISHHARPLDAALYNHAFENAPADDALNQLARYQNADGGFGHALEPDFRLPDASPLATTVALQITTTLNTPAGHPIVRNAIQYLLDTRDTSTNSWPATPPAVDHHPRAPWWDYKPPVSFDKDHELWPNPTLEIIGHLNRYAPDADTTLLNILNNHAMLWLHMTDKPEPHALLCAQRYAQTLTGDNARRASQRITAMALAVTATNPDDWHHYGPQPLWFCHTPDHPLATTFGDALDANLDFLINQQSPDGSWQPAWQWNQHEETWLTAKQEWAGHLTLHNLKILKTFNRLP
ncbi:hypothetical protein [Mucisphaera calidilacus]|uniref:Uncharacterized protein n=1 Tax=Mucisphaera calidilacus TaxID=2527982 RepID=A0A518BTX2_9BACT|nr:hypothetical protein [Mucisphaera calidilacus]QDU70409.1 hypothetical protein Pan265_02360 [Mucisphaera calidilacus]